MTRSADYKISTSLLNRLCVMAICLLMSPAEAMRENDQDAAQRAAKLSLMVPVGSHLTMVLQGILSDQRDDVEANALSLWNQEMSGESLVHVIRILGKVEGVERSEVVELTKKLLPPFPHREKEFCELLESVARVSSGDREAVVLKAKHYVEEMIPEVSRASDNPYGNFLRATYYPRFVWYISAVESFKREHFFQCLDSVFERFLEFSDRESITRELSACPTMAARDQLMSSLQNRTPLRARYGWLPQGSVQPPPGGWYVASTYNPPYLRGIRLNESNQ